MSCDRRVMKLLCLRDVLSGRRHQKEDLGSRDQRRCGIVWLGGQQCARRRGRRGRRSNAGARGGGGVATQAVGPKEGFRNAHQHLEGLLYSITTSPTTASWKATAALVRLARYSVFCSPLSTTVRKIYKSLPAIDVSYNNTSSAFHEGVCVLCFV